MNSLFVHGRYFAVTVCLVLSGSTLARGDNSVALKDQTGSAQPARPVTISRVFQQGEIPRYPRPAVGGTPLRSWQSNVLNRWPDGSVKHALISFTQSVAANGVVSVAFLPDSQPCHLGDQAACDAAAPTQAQILTFNSGSWGASIATSANSVNFTPSARSMINNGAWRFWIRGPLVNQIIVEDRSTGLAYDFGYKDRRLAIGTTNYILPTDISISVNDATDIAALPMPTLIQVEAEQIQICSVSANVLNVCAGGRGFGGSAAVLHATYHTWNTQIQALAYPEPTWKASPSAAFNSLHPIFVLTLYTGWPGVKEEFILENTWVTKAQGQIYDLTLKSGVALDKTQYSKKAFAQNTASRWRKIFWDGTIPGALKVDYNLPYMISTRALPSFDTSKVVSSSAVRSQAAAFSATDQGELGGFGQWQPNFSMPGGRPDLGMYPTWSVQYLFTFDPGLYNAVLGNGAAGAYVPVHFRESDASRFFSGNHTVGGFGLPVSVDGRGLCTNGYENSANAHEMPTFVGPNITGNWAPDLAHQADFSYIPYLITGDWYWLEEMYFWASYDLSFTPPGTDYLQRHDGWGFVSVQAAETRGQAWTWRNLANPWFMAPDGDPEQAYLLEKINNNIAIREGQYNITNGSFYDSSSSSKWSWGLNAVNFGVTNNPLRFMDPPGNNPDTAANGVDPSKECLQDSPFEYNLNLMMWGYMEDMGLQQIHPLRESMSPILLGALLDPGFLNNGGPWAAVSYRIPVSSNPGTCPGRPPLAPYFTQWSSVLDAYTPANRANLNQATWIHYNQDPEFGYSNILRAAASYTKTIKVGSYDGAIAWNWVIANTNDPSLNDNPKWALLPRGTVPQAVRTSPTSRCDINGDGQVDSNDVAALNSQLLTGTACPSGDLNRDQSCNVVDLQILVGVILGQSCPP